MVDYSGMFRADPRIKRRRRFADTLQTQALRPIQAPANPYGFNPLAEALQRVTAAYGGSMASSAADQREAEQRAAQAQVMAQLLKVGSARPDQLIRRQIQEPGPGAMMRTQYSIGNDGSQRAIEPLPAGVFEKAGGIAGGYQTALAAAKAQEDTLTQARLERDIKNRLGEVGAKLANDRNNPELFAEVQQLRSLLDPAGFATEVTGARRKMAETAETRAHVARLLGEEKEYREDLTAEEKEYQAGLTAAQLKQRIADRKQDRAWTLEDKDVLRLEKAANRAADIDEELKRALRNQNWKVVDGLRLRASKLNEDIAAEKRAAKQRLLEAGETIETQKAKELRKLEQKTHAVIDIRPGSPTAGKVVSITQQDLLDDIEREKQGNLREYGEPTGLKLGAAGRIVSTGPFDIGKTDRDKIARERIETAFKVGRAQRFIDVLIDLPRLSGITGAVAERLGGLAGQIPLVGKRLEDAIATKLTGASPQQRANFKVNGRAIIVGMISEMTGEESSRISKAELDITQDSLKVLEAATSPEQIIGAVRSAIKAHMVYLAKADLYLAKNRLQLNDKEAITPYINQLASFGFDQNEIVGIMSQIATAYKLLPDLPNKKGAN